MLIRWYRQLSLYTINSLLYCDNISSFSSGWYTFRASSRLLISPPSPSQRLLHSFFLEQTQKKEIIPYPRCGFGACFKMRTSILKHSDYRADGIWYGFFFRLFSLNESNSNILFHVLLFLLSFPDVPCKEGESQETGWDW